MGVHIGIPKPPNAHVGLNDILGHVQHLLHMTEGSGNTCEDIGLNAWRQEYNGPYDLSDGGIYHNLAGTETAGIKSGATLWDASTHAANHGAVLDFTEGNQNSSVHYVPIMRNTTGGAVLLDQYTFVAAVYLPGTAASTYNVLSSNTENGTANTNAAGGMKISIPSGGTSFRLRHWNSSNTVRIADTAGVTGWNLVAARGASNGGNAQLFINSLSNVSTLTQTDWNVNLPNGKMLYLGAGGGAAATNWLPDSYGGPIAIPIAGVLSTWAPDWWLDCLFNDFYQLTRKPSSAIIGKRQITQSTSPRVALNKVNAAGDETTLTIAARSNASGVETDHAPRIGVLHRARADSSWTGPVWSDKLDPGDARALMQVDLTVTPGAERLLKYVYSDDDVESGATFAFPGPVHNIMAMPAYEDDVVADVTVMAGFENHCGTDGDDGEGGSGTGGVPAVGLPSGIEALRADPVRRNEFLTMEALKAACARRLYHDYTNIIVVMIGDHAMADNSEANSTNDDQPEMDDRWEVVNYVCQLAGYLGYEVWITSNHDTGFKGQFLGDRSDILNETPDEGSPGAMLKQKRRAFIHHGLLIPEPTDFYEDLTGIGANESTAEYRPTTADSDAEGTNYTTEQIETYYDDADGTMNNPQGLHRVIPWGNLLIYTWDVYGVGGWSGGDKLGLAAASANYGGIGPCGGQHQRVNDSEFCLSRGNVAHFEAYNALEGFERIAFGHAMPNSDQIVSGTGLPYNRNSGQVTGSASAEWRVLMNGFLFAAQGHNHTAGHAQCEGLDFWTCPSGGAVQTWGGSQSWVNGNQGNGSYGTAQTQGAKLFNGVTDNRASFLKRQNIGSGFLEFTFDGDGGYTGKVIDCAPRIDEDGLLDLSTTRFIAADPSTSSIGTLTVIVPNTDEPPPNYVAIVALAADIVTTWYATADWQLADDASATWPEWNYAILDRRAHFLDHEPPFDAGSRNAALHDDVGGAVSVYVAAYPRVTYEFDGEAAPEFAIAERKGRTDWNLGALRRPKFWSW